MSAYQFLNPAPVLFTINGIEPVAGGKLYFYDEGTTTPRNTWSDPGLIVLNSNPVVLGASGRSSTGIWLDGDYTVVLRDAFGDEVWSRVVRSDVVASLSIPTLAPGFLTNDLSNLLWQDILLIPDPSGSTNYILSTDGANLLWIPQPTVPPPENANVTVTASSVSMDDGTSTMLIQAGTGSCTTTTGKTASTTVTFATAFSSAPVYVGVIATSASYTSTGATATPSVTVKNTTGFTVVWTIGETDDTQSKYNFNGTPVPFNYVAMGIAP